MFWGFGEESYCFDFKSNQDNPCYWGKIYIKSNLLHRNFKKQKVLLKEINMLNPFLNFLNSNKKRILLLQNEQ